MAELWSITAPLIPNEFGPNLEFRLRKICTTKCIRKIPNLCCRSRTLELQISYVNFWKLMHSPKSLLAAYQQQQKKGKSKNPSQQLIYPQFLSFSLCSCRKWSGVSSQKLTTPFPAENYCVAKKRTRVQQIKKGLLVVKVIYKWLFRFGCHADQPIIIFNGSSK